MKRVIITGASGTLGNALAHYYQNNGYEVIGISRFAGQLSHCQRCLVNQQRSLEDADELLKHEPDLIILTAGQIETELGDQGLPLTNSFHQLNQINYEFPSLLALNAANRALRKSLDIIIIGSIADGSPSCFGPLYHASKAAAHFFATGTGPIAHHKNPMLRLRLYRPGVIKGPLSWSPTLRLNKKAFRIRARRCEAAPDARIVAKRIALWIDGHQWIGSDPVPLSFRFLAILFVLAPNLYYKLQLWAWRRACRWPHTDSIIMSPESQVAKP